MYYTCNPGNVGHAWVKRLFIDRCYTAAERPEDYAFIPARIYDNKMYSHLINPKTGSAVVGRTNEVVLMGKDGSKGDALATAFMFMNDAERLALAGLEGFKYAIYDSTNTFEGWSFVSEGLNIERTKTNK